MTYQEVPDLQNLGGSDGGARGAAAHDASTGLAPAPGVAQDILDSGDEDVLGGVLGLSMLLTDGLSLENQLAQVAAFAVEAIAGADGAGVAVVESGRRETIVASDQFVKDVDAVQYRLGEGPCIRADELAIPIRSGDLANDSAWPRFGSEAAKLGVHSALSLPLLLPDRCIGAINIYAREHDAFSADAERLGQLFAAPATVAVRNAMILADSQRRVAQLQAALGSRATIDHAIGILLSRSGGTADEAFARLRVISQTEHTRLAEVAASVVEEATRRARARHSHAPDPAAIVT